MNLPEAEAVPASIGEADLEWIDFSIEHGIDLLAVSFVRSPADLDPVNQRLAPHRSGIPGFPKNEKRGGAAAGRGVLPAAAGGGPGGRGGAPPRRATTT